jgi:Domain of unknown function (DUF1707)
VTARATGPAVPAREPAGDDDEDIMSRPDPSTADPNSADPTVVPPPGALRCSDADRERVSAALHAAAGEGRLSMEETEKRLEAVYVARYCVELDALTADLPPPPDAPSGWGAVVALARQQLVADVATLTGRTCGTEEISRRRRLLLVLTAVAVVLIVATMIGLAMHGILADGPEYEPGFEHWDRGRLPR